MPSAGYGGCLPVFETDPPEFPESWHSAPYRTTGANPVVHGPFGATVHLPRHLPPELRVFTTPRIHATKNGAKRRVAFQAYKALYDFTGDRWLNDNLLPLSHLGEDMEALFAAGIESERIFRCCCSDEPVVLRVTNCIGGPSAQHRSSSRYGFHHQTRTSPAFG